MKSPLNNHVLILVKLSIYMELIREPGQVFSCLCPDVTHWFSKHSATHSSQGQKWKGTTLGFCFH